MKAGGGGGKGRKGGERGKGERWSGEHTHLDIVDVGVATHMLAVSGHTAIWNQESGKCLATYAKDGVGGLEEQRAGKVRVCCGPVQARVEHRTVAACGQRGAGRRPTAREDVGEVGSGGEGPDAVSVHAVCRNATLVPDVPQLQRAV